MKVAIHTQTYLTWAEWPDQPQNPCDGGWSWVEGALGTDEKSFLSESVTQGTNPGLSEEGEGQCAPRSPLRKVAESMRDPKVNVFAQTRLHWEEPQAQSTRDRGLGETAQRCLEVPPNSDGCGAPSDPGQGAAASLRGGVKIMGHGADRPSKDGLEPHLRVKVTLQLPGAEGAWQAMALLDTGAEVCLIRRGLLPADAFRDANRPLRLVTASNRPLGGGTTETQVDMRCLGSDTEAKKKYEVVMPTTLYEADIDEDIILSYRWMGERDVRVVPRRHGFWVDTDEQKLWVAGQRHGAKTWTNQDVPRKPVYVNTIPTKPTEPEKPRALDLFCGRKSAARVLERWGYEVTTLDNDPKRSPTICADVLRWDYERLYPPGSFQIVVASPPCTEYSRALTKRVPQMEQADQVVRKAIEVIRYLDPPVWWLETPRNGRLVQRKLVEGLPYVDVDYCQFVQCGYQKPTRFYGSAHITKLAAVLCDGQTCPSLDYRQPVCPGKRRRHVHRKGGSTGHVITEEACYIPENVIEYVTGLAPPPTPWADPIGGRGRREPRDGYPQVPANAQGSVVEQTEEEEDRRENTLTDESEVEEEEEIRKLVENPEWAETLEEVRGWHLLEDMRVSFEEEGPVRELDEAAVKEVAAHLLQSKMTVNNIKKDTKGLEMATGELAEKLRKALLEEFGETAMSGKYKPNPPVRGPNGEAEIWLRPDAKPLSVPPFQLTGERRQALADLVAAAEAIGKLEPGKGPWNTPAFPVPKKTPGSFRLVQDLRAVNAATIKDGHPLPRIGAMVQRQGKNKVWTTLDLVDGYHQMPMKKEHRYATCMSTPHGTKQWTVQVMGLRNAGAQFQRMMEWVLTDHPSADPYLDDVVIGSTGETMEEAIQNNYKEVRKVLADAKNFQMVYKPTSEVFQKEVIFCGHILRENRRSPAPGKLAPIQFWERPDTVTGLRAFLGLTNYFAEYVHHYADLAAPLSNKLCLNRKDGKKGSKMKLIWTPEEDAAFKEMKKG